MPSNIVEYTLKISDSGAKVELKKLTEGADDLGNELEKTSKKAEKTTKSMFNGFADVKAGIDFAKESIGFLIGFVSDLANSLRDFTQASVDMINDLGDIGNRSGIAAESIGGLKAAFHASGQDAAQVHQVLDVVAKKLGSLSRGSKSAEKAFEKYGIATRDLEGNLRSNNDILLESMDIIQGLADTSLRSRAAVELFGVGGQRLSQALGAGDFKEFVNFVNEFGAVGGPKAAKSAALVQDSISLAQVAQEGFNEELVLSLNLMHLYQKALNFKMAALAGLKSIMEGQGQLVKEVANAFFEFGQSTLGFFTEVLIGSQSASTGIRAVLENIFLVGQAIFKRLLSPMANFLFLSREIAEFMGSSYSKDLDKALKATQKLGRLLSHDTAEGMGLFNSFSDGASNALDAFQKIVKGSTHEISGFEEVIDDTSESVEEATEQFDALGASISIVSKAMQKIGIPKELTPEGMRELVDTIMVLGQGLEQMGLEGSFSGSNILKTDTNNLAQQFGLQIQSAAPAIGKAFGVFSGIQKIIQIAEKLGKRGETVGEIQQSVQQQIKQRAKSIELGLKALPPIIFETLPPILSRLAMDLIIGLGGLFSELVSRFLSGIKEALTINNKTRAERTEASFDFIRSFFKAIAFDFEGFKSGGRLIPSAAGGIRFTGAEQGLALLHKNEYVVPETGQAPQAIQRSLGAASNGGIVLNINATVVQENAIDELVRQIERRFLTFGSSKSPLFGS